MDATQTTTAAETLTASYPDGSHMPADMEAQLADQARWASVNGVSVWTFPDSSKVVVGPNGAWDLGFADTDCTCWVGSGHQCQSDA